MQQLERNVVTLRSAPRLHLSYAGKTNVGMKRTHNEDNLHIAAGDRDEQLFLVADGMGGHASGEIASQMAVETVASFFKATAEEAEVTWPFKMDRARKYDENRLITGIKLANLKIYESAQRDPKFRGMGTTLVSTFFVDGGAYIAHVGDSRVYRIRDAQIHQLTEDHSLLNDYIKMKKLTQEEIDNFPHKNVIVRALGMKETVQVDVRFEPPRVADIFLLCSDGLSGMVSDDEMLEIVSSTPDLEASSNRLIDLANQHGGVDNITVVLVRIDGV